MGLIITIANNLSFLPSVSSLSISFYLHSQGNIILLSWEWKMRENRCSSPENSHMQFLICLWNTVFWQDESLTQEFWHSAFVPERRLAARSPRPEFCVEAGQGGSGNRSLCKGKALPPGTTSPFAQCFFITNYGRRCMAHRAAPEVEHSRAPYLWSCLPWFQLHMVSWGVEADDPLPDKSAGPQ